MYKISIVDDDRAVCHEMKEHLELVAEELKIEVELSIWTTGEELYEHLKAGNWQDLIFLDVVLVEKDGIWLGGIIREELEDYKTNIVYFSHEKNYALQLFASQPLDFLIKPVLKEDIMRVMRRFLKRNEATKLQFCFKKGHMHCNAFCDDILYFQSMGRKVMIVERQNTQEFYGKLDEVKQQLGDNFLQIHKSYLVNEDYIRQYMYEKVIMYNGEEISISKPYRNQVQEKLLEENGIWGGKACESPGEPKHK